MNSSNFVVVLALSVGLGCSSVRADGPPETGAPSAHGAVARPPARDPLAVDAGIAVRDTPPAAIHLPGVLDLEGADKDLLDPTRARRISWTNGGSQTVYVSASDPNRIQLPFVNPHVVATTDIEVDKRANSNNVYVTFASGVNRAVQIWFEPQGGSSMSIGLQLVPKRIPAQSILVVDDTVAVLNARASAPGSGDDFLDRAQGELEVAAAGQSPAGWSVVNLQVPLVALNGLVVEGVRRLSSRVEDIFVYSVTNPGTTDVTLHEREFDGETVEAVSILPTPLLHPGQKTLVSVLARKREGREGGEGGPQ